RYEHWLKSAVRGDLGLSLAYNTPVVSLLLPRAKNTLVLTGLATLLAWMIAIPLGIWSSAGRSSWRGHMVETATSSLLVIPEMILAVACLWIAVRTPAFPVGGMTSTQFAELSWWAKTKDLASHLAVPVTVLALGRLPAFVRDVRSTMSEALGTPSICAARAHGIPRRW